MCVCVIVCVCLCVSVCGCGCVCVCVSLFFSLQSVFAVCVVKFGQPFPVYPNSCLRPCLEFPVVLNNLCHSLLLNRCLSPCVSLSFSLSLYPSYRSRSCFSNSLCVFILSLTCAALYPVCTCISTSWTAGLGPTSDTSHNPMSSRNASLCRMEPLEWRFGVHHVPVKGPPRNPQNKLSLWPLNWHAYGHRAGTQLVF